MFNLGCYCYAVLHIFRPVSIRYVTSLVLKTPCVAEYVYITP